MGLAGQVARMGGGGEARTGFFVGKAQGKKLLEKRWR